MLVVGVITFEPVRGRGDRNRITCIRKGRIPRLARLRLEAGTMRYLNWVVQ